jgi:hypothetical protein
VQGSYRLRERPLSPDDYDVPVGWWGWSWEPPVPLSVVQLLEAGNMDARTAAFCWMVLEAHGSLLIAAEQPHSGKTTTLTAFLDFVPSATKRVFLRGWSETFDYLTQTDPAHTLLLANEISSHLPVYLWGEKATATFRTLRRGYALASTLHADTAAEAVAQLTDEVGVESADLARVDLLMVMRLLHAPGVGLIRRVVSLDRLSLEGRRVTSRALVRWEPRGDRHVHDEDAELRLLNERLADGARGDIESDLRRRSEFLTGLVRSRVRRLAAVRAALAAYRGEAVASSLQGDPA